MVSAGLPSSWIWFCGIMVAVIAAATTSVFAVNSAIASGHLGRSIEVIALAVVDSCMVHRDVLDPVKQQVSEATGIPAENILVSARAQEDIPMDDLLDAFQSHAR